jgi:hypothetical protein
MDPVTQTLAQQQSGSAGGQGFGQFFVAGQQNARQKEQLNLARRQEDRLAERQRTLLPYEKALMGMQVIDAGLTAHSNRLKLENQIISNQGLPEILALENFFMESPNGYKDADGIAAYKQLYSKYPQAFSEGAVGHALRMRVQAPVMFDAEMDRLEKARQRFPNLQRLDPKSGEITLSPRYDTEVVTETIDGKPRSFLRDASGRLRSLPENISQRQLEAFKRSESAKDVGVVRESRPDLLPTLPRNEQGVAYVPPATMQEAAKTAGMQGATKTLLEQQSIGAENVVNLGRRLLPLLNDENVGPEGWFKRRVIERIPGAKAALSPFINLDNTTDAVAAETLGRQFLGQVFKAVRSDSNINEKEYAQIVQAAPTPEAFFTKPSSEKRKLREFLISARDTARTNARRTGKPLSNFFLSTSELEARIEAGDLTAPQAADIYNQSAAALLDAIEANPQ